MKAEDKIFVAGHRGMAGSAVTRALSTAGYRNVIVRHRKDLDLTDRHAVSSFFEIEKPKYVVIAAAKVGGILANDTFPAEFIHQNLAIQDNLIHESWRSGAKRLVFLGSSCIYPRDCAQPIKEDYLLTGQLEHTNRAYAVAKIAGIETCAAYNRQYGTEFVCAMPTNLYGEGDNYDLSTSHVFAALIRKAHEAKRSRSTELNVWGTGQPRREFLSSDDLAAACLMLLQLPWSNLSQAFRQPRLPLLNVGTGTDVTIRELAEAICDVVGFDGRLKWDTTKPDGTPRKLLDVSRMQSLGWSPRIDIRSGIALAYSDFLGREHSCQPV
jgi:GDP-L-fucose synthase